MNDQLFKRIMSVLLLRYLDADSVEKIEILNCMNLLILGRREAHEH